MQMPYMVIGVLIAIVGTTLLTRIGLETKVVQWAAYSVVTGIGLGLGIQLPYTAAQAVLRYGKMHGLDLTKLVD